MTDTSGSDGCLLWDVDMTTDGDGAPVWAWHVTHQVTGEHAAGETRSEDTARRMVSMAVAVLAGDRVSAVAR